jgi:hypothetical protein
MDTNLSDRLIQCFDNEHHCDVEVQLDDGSILKAHCLVLSISSTWFKTALSERWVPAGQERIRRLDCIYDGHSASTVRQVIRYMSTNDLSLTLDNIEKAMACSSNYNILGLTNQCSQYLLNEHITLTNVLRVFKVGYIHYMTNVLNACYEFIDKNLDVLFTTTAADVYELPHECIMLLISRNSLCIHEEIMFEQLTEYLVQFLGAEDRDISRSEEWAKI